MKAFALAALLVASNGSTNAASATPDDRSDAAAFRGSALNCSRAEGSYHVAYSRRGCRIVEDWDGRQYTASVRCLPGVKPD